MSALSSFLIQLFLLGISIYSVIIHTADTEYKIVTNSEDFKL